MKKQTCKLYEEYSKKYEKYNLDAKRLKSVEAICIKKYRKDMGISKDTYTKVNLYLESLNQLYNKIDELPELNQYKAIVLAHSNEIIKYLDNSEIEIIFDDTIDETKANYDTKETLGSYIVRNFKNNLVCYVNEKYNKNFDLINKENAFYKVKK